MQDAALGHASARTGVALHQRLERTVALALPPPDRARALDEEKRAGQACGMANAQIFRPSTPVAIIEAAERLFGELGIEGVSIRQIGLEAKVANKSAVSYHFGDRADLVTAIWNYRLPVLEVRRQQLLAELRAQHKVHDAHAVVRTLVLPLFETVDSNGHHRYAAFFLAAMRWHEGKALREEQLAQTPGSADALAMLSAIASELSTDQLHWRLRFAVMSFLDMIVARDADTGRTMPRLSNAMFLCEGIDMIVAHCLRPWPA